ncbi:MAG: MerR family transcriptional regulator [Methylococcales bacterium]
MSEKLLTISVVAKIAGIGVETIRYYQRIGLVEIPEKPITGYRIYPDDTVSRLLFIRRAKQLGFSLSEISTLFVLGDGKCVETKQLASDKIKNINCKINDLQSIVATLEKLVECCEDNPLHHGCPIISAISNNKLST